MTIKKIVCTSLLAISLSSVAVLAHASITILNNTSKDSTSILNDGVCSSTLPGGVTKAGQKNEVGDIIINMACWGHTSDCKADIYMTDHCNTNNNNAVKVATVIFDTKKGIIPPIKNYTTDFTISGSGFKISLDGGPAKLASKN